MAYSVFETSNMYCAFVTRNVDAGVGAFAYDYFECRSGSGDLLFECGVKHV
jgi:hypothetical protein